MDIDVEAGDDGLSGSCMTDTSIKFKSPEVEVLASAAARFSCLSRRFLSASSVLPLLAASPPLDPSLWTELCISASLRLVFHLTFSSCDGLRCAS